MKKKHEILTSKRNDLKEASKSLEEATVSSRLATVAKAYPSLPPSIQARLLLVLSSSSLPPPFPLSAASTHLCNHYHVKLRSSPLDRESVESLVHLGSAPALSLIAADALPQDMGSVTAEHLGLARLYKSVASECDDAALSLVVSPVVSRMVATGGLSLTRFTAEDHARFVEFRDWACAELGEEGGGGDPFHTDVYYQMRSKEIRGEFEAALEGREYGRAWEAVEGAGGEKIEKYRFFKLRLAMCNRFREVREGGGRRFGAPTFSSPSLLTSWSLRRFARWRRGWRAWPWVSLASASWPVAPAA